MLRLLVADEPERDVVTLETLLLFEELFDEVVPVTLPLPDVALPRLTEPFCAAEALEPPRDD